MVAKLIDEILPTLPVGTVVVPIPTIASHIRMRGFGHTEIVAKKLAQTRHLKCSLKLLLRADNLIQHGYKFARTQETSPKAFEINEK